MLGLSRAGKTAWCTKQFADALRIDPLDGAVMREYSSRPERLVENVMANLDRKHIVIARAVGSKGYHARAFS